MNIIENKKIRTNKTRTTVVVCLATLLLGMAIGGAAAETGTGLLLLDKPAKTATNAPASAAASGVQAGGMNAWNPFSEIRQMRQQMDQSFDRLFDQFRAAPQFNAFNTNPGYSLSLNVQDLKNRYEVQAYLPDAKASDIHVSLKNGRTLDVTVNHQSNLKANGKNATSDVAEWNQYEQEVQLPTPVKAGQMKIKHEGHELIITIPKAA